MSFSLQLIKLWPQFKYLLWVSNEQLYLFSYGWRTESSVNRVWTRGESAHEKAEGTLLSILPTDQSVLLSDSQCVLKAYLETPNGLFGRTCWPLLYRFFSVFIAEILISPDVFRPVLSAGIFPGVPVSSRVSAKIQQLVNTLKQPRRPPLREFFVDDFDELLEG